MRKQSLLLQSPALTCFLHQPDAEQFDRHLRLINVHVGAVLGHAPTELPPLCGDGLPHDLLPHLLGERIVVLRQPERGPPKRGKLRSASCTDGSPGNDQAERLQLVSLCFSAMSSLGIFQVRRSTHFPSKTGSSISTPRKIVETLRPATTAAEGGRRDIGDGDRPPAKASLRG